MKRKVLWIVIGVIMVLVIVGIVIFVKKVQADTKESIKVMDEIKENYSLLEDNIKEYNELRADLSNKLKNVYLDNFGNDYSKMVELLDKLELNIKYDKNVVDSLDDDCLDRVFNDTKVNTICSSYKEYYEKLVNVYFNDINEFNLVIDNYNDSNDKKLDIYVSDEVKDYIDYNKDLKYLEKRDES